MPPLFNRHIGRVRNQQRNRRALCRGECPRHCNEDVDEPTLRAFCNFIRQVREMLLKTHKKYERLGNIFQKRK